MEKRVEEGRREMRNGEEGGGIEKREMELRRGRWN